MANSGKVLESSSAVVPETIFFKSTSSESTSSETTNSKTVASEKETFSLFHHLPVLLQWKIFREYIPLLYKAFVLYRMPKFCRLLEQPESWMKPSLFECFSLLCFLQKGIYIYLENFAKKAFYVSMDQTKITFTLCGLDATPTTYKQCAVSSECPINPLDPGCVMKVTLSNFQKFLKSFLTYYISSRDQVIKVYQFHGLFFVNYSTHKVCWIDGKVYNVINRLCTIRFGPYKWYHIFLKDNYEIELKINPVHIFGEKNENCFTLNTEILTPTSLETLLLRNENQACHSRTICKITFEFMTEDSLISDVYAFNPKMCLEYLDATLMDCLDLKYVFDKYNIV